MVICLRLKVFAWWFRGSSVKENEEGGVFSGLNLVSTKVHMDQTCTCSHIAWSLHHPYSMYIFQAAFG